jgi:hypothetical protein
VNGKEDMRGQRHSGEGLLEFWGKEHFERGTVFFVCLIFFWFGVWVDCYRGAPGCWEFWARGPGILTESWS